MPPVLTSIQQPSLNRQGNFNNVLPVMIYHRQHQVAVFRDRIERANEAPHAVLLQRL
jgi:hypothetical protein